MSLCDGEMEVVDEIFWVEYSCGESSDFGDERNQNTPGSSAIDRPRGYGHLRRRPEGPAVLRLLKGARDLCDRRHA